MLLNQSCRILGHNPSESALTQSTVKEAVRDIKKLRPPPQNTEKKDASRSETSGSAGSQAESEAEWEATPGGNSVKIRLRMPADFAGLLLALPPNQRWEALRLALDRRIGGLWNLSAVISSATELREMSMQLNQFCLQFGSGDSESKLLESAVKEAVQVTNSLRQPSMNTERKESRNESDY